MVQVVVTCSATTLMSRFGVTAQEGAEWTRTGTRADAESETQRLVFVGGLADAAQQRGRSPDKIHERVARGSRREATSQAPAGQPHTQGGGSPASLLTSPRHADLPRDYLYTAHDGWGGHQRAAP